MTKIIDFLFKKGRVRNNRKALVSQSFPNKQQQTKKTSHYLFSAGG